MAITDSYGIDSITTKTPRVPSRIVPYGAGGVGKTSFAAQFPKPVFIIVAGETGLLSLLSAGQLSNVPHFPIVENLDQLYLTLGALSGEHPYQTIVLDSLSALEQVVSDHVCTRDFKGDFGERGFGGYGRGYKMVAQEFDMILKMLEQLWLRGLTIILIGHSHVTTFKNPEGPDFDRYTVNLRDAFWAKVKEWADEVWFMKSGVSIDASERKATGDYVRYLHTLDHPSYDAKSRKGMPATIKLGESAKESYDLVMAAAKAVKLQPQPEKETANADES